MEHTPPHTVPFQSSRVHGAYYPAPVYPGMGVTARVEEEDGSSTPLRVWRLSPHGIEFVYHDALAAPVGQELLFELTLGQHTFKYVGVLVSCGHYDEDVRLVGLTYEPCVRPELPANAEREARQHRRFESHPQFFPTGVAQAPLTFQDAILFSVKNVSAAGLLLHTSLRNKFLLPGMILEAQVHFPPMAQTRLKLLIVNIRVAEASGRKYQVMGVKILERDANFAEAMGHYIVQFGQASRAPTPRDIRSQGLSLSGLGHSVDWVFADSVADFSDVAALRRETQGEQTEAEVAHQAHYDARSRVLMGRFRGRLIACVRLVFCTLEDDLYELESVRPLPPKYLDRLATAEVGLLCVHPDFHESDLTLDMLRFAFFVMLQARRRQALFACPPEMVPLMQQAGFVDTQETLPMQAGLRARWHIMHADVEAIVEGRSIGPMMWNRLFHHETGHLHQQQWQRMGKIDSMRLATYRLLRPAARWLKPKNSRTRS